MKRFSLFTLLSIFIALGASSRQAWIPDTAALGPDFQTLTITLPSDGNIPITIIRAADPARRDFRRGALYIHGFNDYFFQAAMADSFAVHRYAFYAIDLQRYGRSLRQGQTPCDAPHGLNEYFPAIDSALCVMQQNGIDSITLIGHSTGGLIAAYFLARNPSAPVRNLILNSPFLAWNLGSLNHAIPLVSTLGAIFPGMKFKQGASDAYAYSLLKDHHGLWDYRTDWKRIHSPDVTAGWIRSITRAQNYLKHHPGCIHVPTLLLTSARAYSGNEWTPAADSADAVLNPAEIRRIGITLPAQGATSVVVDGGLHDLVLSSPSVARPLYRLIFRWLPQ